MQHSRAHNRSRSKPPHQDEMLLSGIVGLKTLHDTKDCLCHMLEERGGVSNGITLASGTTQLRVGRRQPTKGYVLRRGRENDYAVSTGVTNTIVDTASQQRDIEPVIAAPTSTTIRDGCLERLARFQT